MTTPIERPEDPDDLLAEESSVPVAAEDAPDPSMAVAEPAAPAVEPGLETPEADAVEQAQEVQSDEDEYR